MEKQCSKCGVVKPFADFHKRKRNNDGLETSCKNCKREYREKFAETDRKYYKANREKFIEMNRKYREANPEKNC